jgi:hypothetical protein
LTWEKQEKSIGRNSLQQHDEYKMRMNAQSRMRQNHNSAAAIANVHDAHGYFAYRHDGTNLIEHLVVEAEKCAVANAIRTLVTQQLYRARSFVLRGSWQRRPRRARSCAAAGGGVCARFAGWR